MKTYALYNLVLWLTSFSDMIRKDLWMLSEYIIYKQIKQRLNILNLLNHICYNWDAYELGLTNKLLLYKFDFCDFKFHFVQFYLTVGNLKLISNSVLLILFFLLPIGFGVVSMAATSLGQWWWYSWQTY